MTSKINVTNEESGHSADDRTSMYFTNLFVKRWETATSKMILLYDTTAIADKLQRQIHNYLADAK